jgi:hypothetical protein
MASGIAGLTTPRCTTLCYVVSLNQSLANRLTSWVSSSRQAYDSLSFWRLKSEVRFGLRVSSLG